LTKIRKAYKKLSILVAEELFLQERIALEDRTEDNLWLSILVAEELFLQACDW